MPRESWTRRQRDEVRLRTGIVDGTVLAMAVWEIDLIVQGPLTLRERFSLREQKGHDPDDPFFSNVSLGSNSRGFSATVEARADNQGLAYEAAFIFFGRMLDALALEVNEPLLLRDNREPQAGSARFQNRRILTRAEVANAFSVVSRFRLENPALLRSLSWYRKGSNTEDRFDQFLALWNAIEHVSASNYARIPNVDLKRARGGSKNQIWACFNALWPTADLWSDAAARNRWLDTGNQLRNEIAHGFVDVTLPKVQEVSTQLPVLRDIARQYLIGWRDTLTGRLQREI